MLLRVDGRDECKRLLHFVFIIPHLKTLEYFVIEAAVVVYMVKCPNTVALHFDIVLILLHTLVL